MPRDVAVEGPQPRVVGDEADHCPRVRGEGEGVADQRVRIARRARRVDVGVVVGPVERAGAALKDPLGGCQSVRACF